MRPPLQHGVRRVFQFAVKRLKNCVSPAPEQPHRARDADRLRRYMSVALEAARRGSPAGARLDSMDQLRGLVIVVMALDHVRDFFHAGSYQGANPLDVDHTSVVLYVTRWITHLCAPTFVFLAGVGAYWRGHRAPGPFTREAKAALSRFLLTRGLWLCVLELTYVGWLGWSMSFEPRLYGLKVIFALGASMAALAGLIWLPHRVVAALGVAIVALHNLTDGWMPSGALAPLWRILHVQSPIHAWTAIRVSVSYPVLPWLGVMLLGYAFGPLAMAAAPARRRHLLRFGLGALAAFAVLRGLDLYGNPTPWVPRGDWLRSLGAMFDVSKYPPSLAYVLATLGFALLIWRWLDAAAPRGLGWLTVFGAVPMFVYLLHLPLVHLLSAGFHQVLRGDGGFLIGERYVAGGGANIGHAFVRAQSWPAAPGFSLGVVYLVWIALILALYPVARWFAGVKRRHRDWWWLSYL
jgi:uncharacterized membrane protein